MRSASLGTVAILAALAACAESGGEIKGGELTDAGLGATTPPAFTPDAPDTGVEDGTCNGTGTKWSDLYNDVFGPTGQPGSCSFASNCHGAGAKVVGGIQCFDEKGCRASFFERGLVAASDAAAPESSVLLQGLLRVRNADGTITGFMPQMPAGYVFSDRCVERIKTWIRDGAKDD